MEALVLRGGGRDFLPRFDAVGVLSFVMDDMGLAGWGRGGGVGLELAMLEE